MTWLEQLMASIAGSTTVIAVCIWLLRNIIITRLTNSVKHEYDAKLSALESELRQNEELLKADLQSKESQIEALRQGALANAANRQNLVFERQLKAIEELWDAVIQYGPAKAVSTQMASINFEYAAKRAPKDAKIREFFKAIDICDVSKLPANQALKTRPFVSPLAWAYFAAYQAIMMHAIIKINMLKIGVDNFEGALDEKKLTDLVAKALPHRVDYIQKYGPAVFHYLLEELEDMMLIAFKMMFDGEDADKETIKKASSIVEEADKLMEANKASASEPREAA